MSSSPLTKSAGALLFLGLAFACATVKEADLALKESKVSSEEQILTSLVLALCTPDSRSRSAA